MILTFRPIKVWPEGWPRSSPKWSPFKATYADTLQLLDRELEALGATSVTLQVDADESQIRLDGQLRSDARVHNQGVILTIETPSHGTLVYACDEFESPGYRGKPHWHENLRAIALGLEALRKVERYGIANRGQQYAGYRELGSGIPLGKAMTVEEAARVLAEAAGWAGQDMPGGLIGQPELVAEAYRQAAKRLHPDAGGDAAAFRRATEARDLLAAQP